MNYRFSNFIGGSFGGEGEDIHFCERSVITVLGNYVTTFDFISSKSHVLPLPNSNLISKVSVNPDFTLLLAVDSNGSGYFFNLKSTKCITRIRFGNSLKNIAFSNCGEFFCVTLGHTVQIWRSPLLRKNTSCRPQLLRKFSAGGVISCIDWSPCSQKILISTEALICKIYSLMDKNAGVLIGHGQKNFKVAFSGASKRIVFTLSHNGSLSKWDEKSVKISKEEWFRSQKFTFNQQGTLISGSFGRDASLLAVGYDSGEVVLFDLLLFAQRKVMNVSNFSLSTCKLSNFNNWIIFGSKKSGRLTLCNWDDEDCVFKHNGHDAEVNSSSFSTDSTLLATGSNDSKVRVWNVYSGECVNVFENHTMSVTAVCFMYSNKVVLSSSIDGTVRAYDLFRSRNFKVLIPNEQCQLGTLSIDSNSEIVCAGALDTFNLYLWSIRSGRLLEIFSGHEAPISTTCFTQSSLLISGSWDKTIRLWDIFGRKQTEVFQHTSDVLSVSVRFDGEQIAAATVTGHIIIWNRKNGEIIGSLENITQELYLGEKVRNSDIGFRSITYSIDGTLIFAVGFELNIAVFDVVSRTLIRKLNFQYNTVTNGRGTKFHVQNISLSPDGSILAVSTPTGVAIFQEVMKGTHGNSYEENVDTSTILVAIKTGNYITALTIALRIKEEINIIMAIMQSVPILQIHETVYGIPDDLQENLLNIVLGNAVDGEAHIQYLLFWIRSLFAIRKSTNISQIAHMKGILTTFHTKHDELGSCVNSNKFSLAYLSSQSGGINLE